MSAPTSWTVLFQVREEESAVLRDAARGETHPWRVSKMTISVPDSDVEPIETLGLAVAGATGEEAVEKATPLYSRCRAAAGLPREEAHVVGWMAGTTTAELHDDMSQEAARLFAGGHYSLAVVRAQTACEIFVRHAVTDMLRRRGGEGLAKNVLRGSSALTETRTQALFFALTGRSITAAAWWQDYKDHIARRNLIVHEGAHVGQNEAKASLRVGDAFRSYVESIWLEDSDARDGDSQPNRLGPP